MTDDWFDFITALLDAGVKLLVVGAHALAAHGLPRATQDLDVRVEPSRENAHRVWEALGRVGAPAESLGITLDDSVTLNTVVQFGVPPNRIGILTAISGVPGFATAWEDRLEQPGPIITPPTPDAASGAVCACSLRSWRVVVIRRSSATSPRARGR